MHRKLELGCGDNFREIAGYTTIGIDTIKPVVIPKGCMFFKYNLSFEKMHMIDDNSVDLVQAFDVFEHCPRVVFCKDEEGKIERLMPFVFLMNDIYRVMKNNSVLIMETPFSDVGFRRDPTHINHFAKDWYHYFSKNDNLYFDQGIITCDFELIKNEFRKYQWQDDDIMRTELKAIKEEKVRVVI